MGMSSYILDKVDEFYDIAQTELSECETLKEFTSVMKPHEHMLLGSSEYEYIQQNGYDDIWHDFWSKYI